MDNKIKKLSLSIVFGFLFMFVILTFYNTFSLEDGYLFDSEVYNIDGNYILGISSKTDIDLFYKYFDLDNCSIEVVDENGQNIKSGYVYNGSKTLVYDAGHNVISRYTNIVYGDVDSNGMVDKDDLEAFGGKLVYSIKLNDYQIKAMDMNLDGSVKINDLLEMDKILNSSYEFLTLNYQEYVLLSGEELRLVPTVKPNKILNQNLIWDSSNDSVAIVNEAGIVRAVSEGETIITAYTMDRKKSATVKIIVDNSVRLKDNEGYSYLNGEKVRVGIRSVDYKNLSCESSSEFASCKIEDNMLVVEPLALGSSIITVYNGDYGSVTYNFSVYKTFVSVLPNYRCFSVNSGGENVYSTFSTEPIDFYATDTEIIKEVYINQDKRLVVKSGNKTGRAFVQVRESDGSMVNVFTTDVYDLRIPAIGGVFKVGEDFVTDIVGGNWYDLECESMDPNKAVCRIEDNKLIVTSLQKGEVEVYVRNKITYNGDVYDCGQAYFLAVMEE